MILPHFTSRASGAEDEESNSCTSCLFYPVDKKMPAIRISTSRRRELVGKVRSAVMKSFLFTFIVWCNCIVLHCDYIVSFELYYIVSYYIVLYCIISYCIVLYCIVLYCIVLYHIALYCIVLHCIVLYCTVLYCIILYCIVLYCIVLYCIILYCMI